MSRGGRREKTKDLSQRRKQISDSVYCQMLKHPASGKGGRKLCAPTKGARAVSWSEQRVPLAHFSSMVAGRLQPLVAQSAKPRRRLSSIASGGGGSLRLTEGVKKWYICSDFRRRNRIYCKGNARIALTRCATRGWRFEALCAEKSVPFPPQNCHFCQRCQ